ncbi:hypothetical protein PV433_10335, partial [Paenibacillus sp. GYB004]|uniref:hypothetical protein n=1 Tax=Paenibacillus sp. GYB004 TaxID=2994393 RepID=UPI002F961B1F
MEILNVGGGRIPLVDKDVERRSSANGPVKPGVLTPEEMAELELKLKQKAGPQVKAWEPTLARDQYLHLRIAGKGRKDITLTHFNNEESKLNRQLKEWNLIDRKREEEAMSKKQLDELTREQYLARRAAGETRTKIMRSIGANTVPFYAKLEGWGLKNKAEEDMALGNLRPTEVAPPGISPADPDTDEERSEQTDPLTGDRILSRVEQRAADKEKELNDVTELAETWQAEANRLREESENLEIQLEEMAAERKRENENAERMLHELKQNKETEINGIIDKWSKIVAERDLVNAGLNDRINELMAENRRLVEIDERESDIAIGIFKENNRLRSENESANEVIDKLRIRVRKLEYERERNEGYMFIRLPILQGEHPIGQRVDTVRMVELFASEIESASMDRGRAAMELF